LISGSTMGCLSPRTTVLQRFYSPKRFYKSSRSDSRMCDHITCLSDDWSEDSVGGNGDQTCRASIRQRVILFWGMPSQFVPHMDWDYNLGVCNVGSTQSSCPLTLFCCADQQTVLIDHAESHKPLRFQMESQCYKCVTRRPLGLCCFSHTEMLERRIGA